MFSPRNPLDSNEGIIKLKGRGLGSLINAAVTSALLASGFRLLSADFTFSYFLPCSVGTFSNITSKGADGCTPCPPGISQDF